MEKINGILVEIFKITPEESLKNLGMDDVPRWDSLTHMDLILKIENEFKIQFKINVLIVDVFNGFPFCHGAF